MYPHDDDDDNPFSKLYDKLGYKRPKKDPPHDKPKDPPTYEATRSTYTLPRHCVPADTLKCLGNTPKSENFHLHFNRLVFIYNDKIGNLSSEAGQDHRGRPIQKLIPTHPTGKEIAETGKIAERVWQLAQKMSDHTQKLIMHPEWRFITGLGGESVYETSISLHHIYGIPYISASSLKGLVRSWIILNKYDNKEELAICDDSFIDLFGCPDQILKVKSDGKKEIFKSRYGGELGVSRKGNIVFFDTFPTKQQTIEADIMNPHYPKYYGGGNWPTDTQSPIPVLFLTVAKDTPFQFTFGYRKATEHTAFGNGEQMVQEIKKYLREALTQHGIGAKTAVGYGYMKE